jgi:3-hydroxyacyl-[acyl-carrier-protein] dehydratase
MSRRARRAALPEIRSGGNPNRTRGRGAAAGGGSTKPPPSCLATADSIISEPLMDLTLPLDYAAIEGILQHRYPFLFVDRITAFEVDKRIVGIKNVSLNERYLSTSTGGVPVLPPTILTEVVAQVGAILILAKPENRQRLPLFAGIQKVRYRRPVYPGDVVEIEATVIRLRNRMGLLKGVARVNGARVIDGSMTFALAPPQAATT